MASGISAFLAQNALSAENQFVPVSPRFADENGAPVLWEVTAIRSNEDQELRRECARAVPGKKGARGKEADFDKYLVRLAVRCTVFPNLHDKALQESYGARCAEELIGAMLLPGEYINYANRVREACGFDVSGEEKAHGAKN